MQKKRFLYLMPGPMPAHKDPRLNKLFGVSEFLTGDVLVPSWWKTQEDATADLGEENYPIFQVGSFKYHTFLLERFPSFIKPIAKMLFFILKGISLSRKHGKYDYIMSYGTNSTGVCAVILKLLFGSKYIAEIPGVLEDGSKYDEPGRLDSWSFEQWLKDLVLHFVVSKADRTKLLYQTQLDHYPKLKDIPSSVFHDFVATESIEDVPTSDNKLILLLGFPWYRKGVDVLIKAFHKIKKEFPEHTLRCAGWYQDRSVIDTLSNDEPRIKITPQVPAKECFELIASCSVLVLPSRSEAMGRVLLEAMAAKKPLIGSDTNGIPSYALHGKNAIIVPKEDDEALAQALRTILSDKEYAKKLGHTGYNYLKEELDEKAYVRKFRLMIEAME